MRTFFMKSKYVSVFPHRLEAILGIPDLGVITGKEDYAWKRQLLANCRGRLPNALADIPIP